MPNVHADMTFLANSPRYETEKPYLALIRPTEDIDPDDERLNNLEWESHRIRFNDLRGFEENFSVANCGFKVLQRPTLNVPLGAVSDLEAYKKQTESVLLKEFSAVRVHCYDLRLRENASFQRKTFDLCDPLGIEKPAKGAHNDLTYKSGPEVIGRYLPPEDQEKYLKPGYRFQIINTWRPLVPVLEDRPLALCDFRSIDPDDLIAADRIFPSKVGEVYYLRFNENQKWHWLEHQTQNELLVFVTYDTKSGGQPRYCPHASFENPRAAADCERRRSVETRSIVISKM